MNRKIKQLSSILIILLFVSCVSEKREAISVENKSEVNRVDEIISIQK